MGDHPVLFIPGPTEVDEELRQLMSMPLMGHRSADFVTAVREVCQLLGEVFRCESHLAFETCPATALMEAGLRNLVPSGARTLHLVGGAFGGRWAKIAESCGRAPDRLEAPWGEAHAPAPVAQQLRSNGPYAAVCITHNETSTGVIQPLAAIAAAVREVAPQTLILVDTVTSLAGAELEFDRWHLDLAFAGSQKCLALPPGLTSYALSERAMQCAANIDARGYLLDFVRAVPDTVAGKTLATPCVPLVFALRRQLQRIEAEGMERRWARHLELQRQTMHWAEQRDIAPFVADPAVRSPTVSCFHASGRDTAQLAQRALEAGFRIDQGYGKLKGATFRIGHMGDHSSERLETCLRALID